MTSSGVGRPGIRRSGLLLVLILLAPRAWADTGSEAGFDRKLAADVYATALAFMTPRILERVPVSQLTRWGLHGLAALDPKLGTDVRGGLVATFRERILISREPPPGEDPRVWAEVAAELGAVAFNVSPELRRVGTEGVIQSFFDELFNHLDPYSRYVPPDEATEERARRSGQGGIGVALAVTGSGIMVREAITDGPAALAGIASGDRLLNVDGRPTRGRDAGTVALWLEGDADTTVSVTWRDRSGRTHSDTIVRALVPPESVFPARIADMLVLRISGFNSRTAERVMHELSRGTTGAHAAAGVVLDLRGNRGGLLRQAIEVAGELLPTGLVVMTSGRDPQASRSFSTAGAEIAQSLPVIALVDGRTASAGEVVAAALADRGRGVVVGSVTLGKGLVQTISPLPDGGELFVSWARILAPLGWPIQGLGVLPQVCTSRGEAELKAELTALSAGRQPLAEALARHRTARAPLPNAQILAIRSACPAAEGRDTDLVAARKLIDDPAAYAAALFPPLSDQEPSARAH